MIGLIFVSFVVGARLFDPRNDDVALLAILVEECQVESGFPQRVDHTAQHRAMKNGRCAAPSSGIGDFFHDVLHPTFKCDVADALGIARVGNFEACHFCVACHFWFERLKDE